jgi:transposase
MTTVTVLQGPERRRRWSVAEKLRIVEECMAEGVSVAEVARRYDVHANLVHVWRRQARTGQLTSSGGIGPARFAPVALVAPKVLDMAPKPDVPGGDGVIELLLKNGRTLRLPDGVAPARVARLVEALEGGGQ